MPLPAPVTIATRPSNRATIPSPLALADRPP
jgi:hypothetical protein